MSTKFNVQDKKSGLLFCNWSNGGVRHVSWNMNFSWDEIFCALRFFLSRMVRVAVVSPAPFLLGSDAVTFFFFFFFCIFQSSILLLEKKKLQTLVSNKKNRKYCPSSSGHWKLKRNEMASEKKYFHFSNEIRIFCSKMPTLRLAWNINFFDDFVWHTQIHTIINFIEFTV